MRTMLRVTIPVAAGNRAIDDGSLPKTIESITKLIQPEAAYFLPEKGFRTAYFFFDMKDSSEMPPIGEPLFRDLDATVEFFPCMNAEDLQKGLAALAGQKS